MPDADHAAAARAAYDATADLYVDRIGTEIAEAIEGDVERELLASFAASLAGDPRPVADLGCGPGRVAALLGRAGCTVVGLDVSAGMLAAARAAHPTVPLVEGTLAGLPFGDATLAGAVLWYSIIHTPPVGLAVVAAEIARVLAPGGRVLTGFQAGGGEPVVRREVQGRPVALTSHRHAPDVVAGVLASAGLVVLDRIERAPERSHEATPQAFLVAAKPRSPGG